MTRKLRDPAQIELQPLEHDPRYRKASEELVDIEKRFAKSEDRIRLAKAKSRGQSPTRPILERARDLLAGGEIVELPTAGEISSAQEELSILNAARLAKYEELQRISGEISEEVCRRFAPTMEDSLRATLEALTALHSALEVQRVIYGRIMGGGYVINEFALPLAVFGAFGGPGDPEAHSNTPAGRFRDLLREKGLTPKGLP